MASTVPAIDYSSRDYASLVVDLETQIPNYLPEWTSRSSSDFGIVLIQLFAYVGDILNYYMDRVANEAFLSTATQRQSVLNIAAMLDYQPAQPAAATVTLSFTATALGCTIPAGTQVQTVGTPTSDPIVFETDEELVLGASATDTVAATQGSTVSDEAVGTSDGTIDQGFTLLNPNIFSGSLQVFVDEGSGPVLWTYKVHIIDAAALDVVYTTAVDESGYVIVLFGDNVDGKVPSTGAVITATYRIGVGARGNVGANTLVQPIQAVIGLSSVTNPSAATGGADAESLNSIRRNAPRSLSAMNRAVTLKDYAALALHVPGVVLASANAVVRTSILLYVAPSGGGQPTTTLQDDVVNYFVDKKEVDATVTVMRPTYVGVNVTVQINVLPQYNRTTIQNNVQNAITNLYAFENVDFGQRVTLSAVYRAIQGVEGVDYGIVTLLARTDVAQSGTNDQTYAANEIPEPGTTTVTATGGLLGS